MSQFGGKNSKKKSSSDSKRHFTVVMGNKEHGLYVSSSPSSAAKKAVTKLCTANKSKKVDFYIREITQGSKKKTYGPYLGHIEKLKEPIELKGRVIKYKPIVKLSAKKGVQKGGNIEELEKEVEDFYLFTSRFNFKESENKNTPAFSFVMQKRIVNKLKSILSKINTLITETNNQEEKQKLLDIKNSIKKDFSNKNINFDKI